MPQQGQFTAADVEQAPVQKGAFTAADIDGAGGGLAPPPGYGSEILGGVGRALGGFIDLGKSILHPTNPLGVVGELGKQAVGALNAGVASAESGEGRAGQTLSVLENAPVIGGMVRKAEQAGPSEHWYGKFAPQTAGAVAEGTTMAAVPKLAEGAGELAGKLPSKPRAIRTISAIEDSHLGQQPTQVPKGQAAAADVIQRMGTTNEYAHPLIQSFNDRVAQSQLAQSQGLPPDPITFKEARTFLKRANEIKYEPGTSKSAQNQLSQFATGLDSDLTTHANANNFGDAYKAGQTEYSRASKMERAADSPMGRRIGGAVGAGIGAGIGAEIPLPYAAYGGGALGYKLGEPAIGSMVRSITGRQAGVGMEPLPAPPGVPPPPAPPEPVFNNASGESAASQEAINRVASQQRQGIKTYRIDTRSGQEIPLYGVDAVDATAGPYDVIVQRGPQGETIMDQGARARPRQTPISRMSSQEAMRTLLQAKEGDISPGEASRRISRGGQSVRVKPLPRPPE